jgi:hypothetical protein
MDGSTSLGTVALSSVGGSQVAGVTTASLAGGNHTVTASYSGDPTFAPSAAPALTQTVARAATNLTASAVVTTQAYLNSHADVHGSVGDLNATLTWAHGAIAGQTVTFTTGTTPLCTAVTDVDGKATCNGASQLATIIANGGYTVTYAGNGNFLGSSARAGTQG